MRTTDTLTKHPWTDAAFERLYDTEFTIVAHAAFIVGGDRQLAAEIAQEAFAVAMASWPRVAAMDRPGAWVRRVAINLALKDRRRRARVDPSASPDGLVADADGAAGVRIDLARAIAELPTNQRLAVVLHYFHDLPVAEVAESLGCAESTARVHLHRGRTALAGRLDGHDEGRDG